MGWSGRLTHWVERIEVNFPSDGVKHNPAPLYNTDQTGSVYRYSVSRDRSSLGQSTDIAAHKNRYDALIKQVKPKNVVLYGVSRGAATTFSALATHNYSNVKLCIIEGPPSSVSHLFKHYFSRFFGKLLYNHLIASLFLGGEHLLDKNFQVRGHVDKFPNHVPLVVISSKKDKVVPHSSSIRLALRVAVKRLKAIEQEESVAPVYFLQLDNPVHHDYARGDKTDAQRYQNFIHAVYQKHELPHIPEYAAQCGIDLNTADLVNGPLKQQVQYQDEFWEQKERRQDIRQEAYKNLKPYSGDSEKIDNVRALSIASYMPLFSKHRSVSFGRSTKTKRQIDLLITQRRNSKSS